MFASSCTNTHVITPVQTFGEVRALWDTTCFTGRGASPAAAPSTSRIVDKVEREKKKNAAIAARRREKIMLQMSKMQKKFIEENKELIDKTPTELTSDESEAMDTGWVVCSGAPMSSWQSSGNQGMAASLLLTLPTLSFTSGFFHHYFKEPEQKKTLLASLGDISMDEKLWITLLTYQLQLGLFLTVTSLLCVASTEPDVPEVMYPIALGPRHSAPSTTSIIKETCILCQESQEVLQNERAMVLSAFVQKWVHSVSSQLLALCKLS